MSAAFQCDMCDDLYKHGFKGSWEKSITVKGKQVDISLKVSKSPHHCKKCWLKFCKVLYDELRNTHIEKQNAANISRTKSV